MNEDPDKDYEVGDEFSSGEEWVSAYAYGVGGMHFEKWLTGRKKSPR